MSANHSSPLSNEALLRKRFIDNSQVEVFRFFDELDSGAKQLFLEQADQIDFRTLNHCIENLVKGSSSRDKPEELIQPAPYIKHPAHGGDSLKWAESFKAGEDFLKKGKLGVVTVAGGQGTRLGFDGPKGALPVTPVQSKPLFQVFAEKILKAQRLYGVTVPWYIMTSPANHSETVSFFEKNGYWGLDSENVFFFQQGVMPAVNFDGKILLASKNEIVMTPDGHGGLIQALSVQRVLDDLKKRGITELMIFQVDNPLIQVFEPSFIGLHISDGSEVSSKMVRKKTPEEKMGVFCLKNNTLGLIEYSDISAEKAAERDGDGNLSYVCGNIASHLISVSFIEEIIAKNFLEKMPFHKAVKKIKSIDETGESVNPESPNGVKFERFLFDILPLASKSLVVECLREEEFSPVKNAKGVDSVESSKSDQSRLFRSWLEDCGVNFSSEILVEVSPLFAADRLEFHKKWARIDKKLQLGGSVYINENMFE